MTSEQPALDCEPNWSDANLTDDEPSIPPDLRGQLPPGAQIDDIPLTGRWL